jgi:lipopolysaccharide export system protein LptA
MTRLPLHHCATAALVAFGLLGVPALAQQPARAAQPAATPAPSAASVAAKPAGGAAAKPAEKSGMLAGFGSGSKEPIKIDSDKLDVYDKEGRAVFSGNVVAVQGESTIRCSVMVVFYEKNRGAGAPRTAAPAQGDSAIKKLDCAGPVTVVSKDQVATGDNAVYDKAGNKIIMTGNVSLSQGPNVTRGERLVYDVEAGVATVETAPGGRVKALFVPGSNNGEGGAKSDGKAEAKPAATGAAAAASGAKPKRPATASN